ncbi:hypothetical protein D3C71_1244770 [compost metagenome]
MSFGSSPASSMLPAKSSFTSASALRNSASEEPVSLSMPASGSSVTSISGHLCSSSSDCFGNCPSLKIISLLWRSPVMLLFSGTTGVYVESVTDTAPRSSASCCLVCPPVESAVTAARTPAFPAGNTSRSAITVIGTLFRQFHFLSFAGLNLDCNFMFILLLAHIELII